MTMFVQNDMLLILDQFQRASDNSFINDAVLTAHFFDLSTGSGASTPLFVTGASNASPIAITSPGHGLTTGQQIVIADVLGNEAANGCWQVTVVDANTVTLNGSAGSGVYTRGGNWWKALANGFNLSLAYVASSNGRYQCTVPYTIDRLNGEASCVIVFCSNYNFQFRQPQQHVDRTQ